jgi:glycosyltransferase involved in cell wall biosynthesis
LVICIATYDKPKALTEVLWSILDQTPALDYEVIVVDDGSPTVETEDVCRKFKTQNGLNVRYFRERHGEAKYGNPARARNIAYKNARAPFIIAQSDDVVHEDRAIRRLFNKLLLEQASGRSSFVLAHVINTDWNLNPIGCGHPANPTLVELCGPRGRRPLFFLGAVSREHVFAIGGNDERFKTPGREDIYFVECLMNGLGLHPVFTDIKGFHLHHARPPMEDFEEAKRVYRQIRAEDKWVAQEGSWPLPVKG